MPLRNKGGKSRAVEKFKDGADQRGTFKVPADLKKEIKVAAAQHGMTEYAIIREAWDLLKEQRGEEWGPAPKVAHSQIGNLTEEEEEICRAVLDFWRDPAARAEDPGGIGAAVLNSFVNRYRSKGS
jgi:hypothetical protein